MEVDAGIIILFLWTLSFNSYFSSSLTFPAALFSATLIFPSVATLLLLLPPAPGKLLPPAPGKLFSPAPGNKESKQDLKIREPGTG
jgi:hypothetical protein